MTPLGEVATSGSPLPPAVCEITEVVDKPGPSSTLGMLRGTIEQYRCLLERVGA